MSTEANEANFIKRDTPVMVVLGNPPYSVSSSNKGAWIESLVSHYKIDLNERNIQPLSDDYIKFIRFGQHLIDKNGEGILAFITNNSFIDGLIHRKMRESLLKSFDKIYILDLHGNAKKKEKAPDGSKDENVFDIMQGVSINLLVKTGKKEKNKSGNIFHSDLFGTRGSKYNYLEKATINDVKWQQLELEQKNFFFIQQNLSLQVDYADFFGLAQLFKSYSSGIKTAKDDVTIQMDSAKIHEVVDNFLKLDVEVLIQLFKTKQNSGWSISKAKSDIGEKKGNYHKILYRPFDHRYTYFTGKAGGFMERPRTETMNYFAQMANLGLITVRQQSTFDFQHIFITDSIMESGAISLQTKEWGFVFPLYVLQTNSEEPNLLQGEKPGSDSRIPNLNRDIVSRIAEKLSLTFTSEKEGIEGTFAPIDILDYIYAVLHSPKYRSKYKEFLKIDFPRVPYPTDAGIFWEMVKLGGELRKVHLLESPIVTQYITRYPIEGDNEVEKIIYQDQKVFINKTQYFDGVPQIAWEFYIGGYQPAQKWLKDRKGRILNFEDIIHYQKIIVALTETDRLMKEIDWVFKV